MEPRLLNATVAWHAGDFKTKAECSQHFNVPYQLLLARINGRQKSHGGHNKTLSNEQEIALRTYLDQCIYAGKYPDRRIIRTAANTILGCGGDDTSFRITVSSMWTTRFLTRYPRYRPVRSKTIAAERQAAGQRDNVEAYFNQWEYMWKKEKLVLSDVWNFDETGFRIGCMRGRMVITHSDQKAAYTADPDNRESVTVIEAISADGRTIHPMVIMQGQIFKEKMFTNDLTDDTLLAMSETGFTNDQLALEYIKHFDKQTRKPKHPECKRLLLMDNHGSHMTVEWMAYCRDAGIIPFTFPAHSTHLLQPLDIGIFQSMKHYHQEYLSEQVVWGGADFNKADFLSILQRMRDRTFKSRVIRSAWEKGGLFPFNPEIVLSAMEVFNPPKQPAQRPITPPDQIGTFNFSLNTATPQLNLDDIKRYSNYIDSRISGAITGTQPVSPTFAHIIQKRDLATFRLMRTGHCATTELAKRAKMEREKAVRRAGNRHLQKFGVITLKEGRFRAAARIDAEDREKAAVADRVQKRQEAKIAKDAAELEKQKLKDEKKRLKEEAKAAKLAKKSGAGVEAVDLGPAPNFAAYLSGR